MRLEFSAGAIIYRKGEGKGRGGSQELQYLTLKRKDWLDFPKGHIEEGESAEQAAKREIKEESGLDVEFVPGFRRSIGYWYMESWTEKKEKIKKGVIYFLARVPQDAKVRISEEHLDYMWNTIEEYRRIKLFKKQMKVLTEADSYARRFEEMEALNRKYAELPKQRKEWSLSGRFVPGDGPLDAKIMFVGQAPGREEDERLKPFVGSAGKLLTKLIGRTGLKREEVYITSVVQFFPPKNRLPTKEEAELCMPFLKEQIRIIRPRLIVVLGNFAAENVAGVKAVMTTHGRLLKHEEYGAHIFVTLHPAAVVRLKKYTELIEGDFDQLKSIIKKTGLG